MCGITGFIGKKADSLKLTLLMYQARERGSDATGIYILRKGIANDNENENTRYYSLDKLSEPVEQFFKKVPNVLKIDTIECMIGHNRAKSTGSNIKENAHPFLYDVNNEISVCAHNGTIDYDLRYEFGDYLKNLLKDKKNNDEVSWSKCDVDSQMIAKYFAIADNDKDINCLSKIPGPYALIYTKAKQKNNVLCLARNKERPLFIAHNTTDCYVSSEKEFLVLAGLSEKEGFVIEEVEPFHKYSIFFNNKIIINKEKYEYFPLFKITNNRNSHNHNSSRTGRFNSCNNYQNFPVRTYYSSIEKANSILQSSQYNDLENLLINIYKYAATDFTHHSVIEKVLMDRGKTYVKYKNYDFEDVFQKGHFFKNFFSLSCLSFIENFDIDKYNYLYGICKDVDIKECKFISSNNKIFLKTSDYYDNTFHIGISNFEELLKILKIGTDLNDENSDFFSNLSNCVILCENLENSLRGKPLRKKASELKELLDEIAVDYTSATYGKCKRILEKLKEEYPKNENVLSIEKFLEKVEIEVYEN